MPIIPPPVNPPYDEIETILNFARVIANDAGISIAGNLLSDTQPYVFPMVQLAFRKLQDRLSNNAIENFPEEVILTGVPAQEASAFSDPSVQCSLGYDGYFDGIGLFSDWALPQNLELPTRLWQRVSGMNAQFNSIRMVPEALPDVPKTSILTCWEWRGDKIWFGGANQVLDLRIRYKRIIEDPYGAATTVIPIIRCAVPLAYLVVEIFAASRGSIVLPVFQQEGEDAIKQLINQTTRKNQRVNYRRIPYSRRSRMW